MITTKEKAIALMQAGAGCVDLSERSLRTAELIDIAKVANRTGAKMRISGAKRLEQLTEIVQAGGRSVEIVFPAS